MVRRLVAAALESPMVEMEAQLPMAVAVVVEAVMVETALVEQHPLSLFRPPVLDLSADYS